MTAPDGTAVPAGRAHGGQCVKSRWPTATGGCSAITEVPVRQQLVHAAAKPFAFYVLGWTARVNSMLEAAVMTLLRGRGLHLSGHTCGWEDRQQPHCFFQPVSAHCTNGRVVHLCTDGSATWGDEAPMGNCAQRSARTKAPSLQNMGLRCRSWAECGAPSLQNVTTACRLLVQSSQRDGAPRQQSGCTSASMAWRTVAQAVLRVQPHIQVQIETEHMRHFEPWWRDGRYGAVHIRRRDKVAPFWWGREAKAVPVCEYAAALARLESAGAPPSRSQPISKPISKPMHVFLATDDFSVLPEFEACAETRRRGWRVHSYPADEEPGRGVKRSVVQRLWAEVTMLVRANWSVVTCSSNIGRLVQMLRSQPARTLASLDTSRAACSSPGFRGVLRSKNRIELLRQRQQFGAQERQRNETDRPWSHVLLGHGG